MTLHREIEFENDICQHLAQQGWLYAEGDAAQYDRARALFPADLTAWIQATQPQAWEQLQKNHGVAAEGVLLERLRKQLDDRGTLDLLRFGMDLVGLRQTLQLAQFKPALAMNPELQARYAANRLRVVRQLRYSLHNENAIDLVLFLNGIPVATAELKSDFTQSVEDAVNQYRFDRQPKSKGQSTAEPLLAFPRGALVHFALSNSEAMMSTHLQGTATRFLPFNRGNQGGKGNPANPQGHPTAYVWEDVWERESWLEIIGRYLVLKRDAKKQITELIFPRYHQLDVTRQLTATVLAEGPGQKYLIQHSAGSGKTNSIAWSAHFLADLHSAAHHKLFDSVLVVSDRNVLDSQLQEAIFGFERTSGVVASITGKSGSKSSELAEALSGNKKIIVCTIQTFPAIHKKLQELASQQGKCFAVIADEAHSSQSGEAAAKLKQLLSAEELKDLADGGEVSSEDLLAAQMSARVGGQQGITYVAFTATPKAKTLELFGRRPQPDLPASAENLPAPFHVYSMRQAIEEGFILDVLKNYTPYTLAFRLASAGQSWEHTEVEKSAAMKGIMRWVRLHPYNISQKVQIVVEHYRENVAPLLQGKAKAMVVVGSRLEAVRWQKAMQSYIRQEQYAINALVAFSGEVHDPESNPESGPEPFSENSQSLNPQLKGREIREAFASEAYQILLVANKFQTGFDQPLLCGMYVDKRLAGIQAVQTLSRLNRAAPGKDTTYILDFVNDPDEILASFQPYYDVAELLDVTDPNLVYDLCARLDAEGHYDEYEVERVVQAELKPRASQAELSAALVPVAERLLKRFASAKQALQAVQASGQAAAATEAKQTMEALQLFKANLGSYLRVYAFLSQIFDYGNTRLEKRALFFKRLLPLLEFGREREEVDLSKVELTHHRLRNTGQRSLLLNPIDDYAKLKPLDATGSAQVHEKETAYLAEIIAKVNELFGAETTEGDKLAWLNTKKEKLLEKTLLIQQALSNTPEQFANSPDLRQLFVDALMESYSAQNQLDTAALNSTALQSQILHLLLGPGRLYEDLRARGEVPRPGA